MLSVEVLTDRIVVPDGMPVPVMVSPASQRSDLIDARDGRRSARQCAVKDEAPGPGRPGSGMPVLALTLPSDTSRSVTAT